MSDDDYRFTDHPERVKLLRRGVEKLAQLRCDIAIPSHPDTNDTVSHLAALERSRTPNPLLDKDACRSLAATYAQRLHARLAEEKGPQNR